MSHLLERCTDEFLEVLETTCTQDESIDTLAICKTFAANTMLRTGFSFRMDERDKTGWEVRDYVTQLALRNIAVFQEGFLHWLSNCFPEFTLVIQLVLRMIESVQKPAVRKLQDAIAPIIYARKWDASEHKKRDLLQSLIDAMDRNCGGSDAAVVPNGTDEGKTTPPKQSFLSPVEAESNVSLVLTAGTVNLSKYSSWLLYLLARHQNVQKKVRDEIKTILRNGGAINYDAVPKMQYLEQVFLESMRTQSSPSGFVTRLVEKELDAGCVKIPEGVSIVIPTYLLHHDPELWQDPGSFDPERFRPETFEHEDAGAYQPFGAGPRNCFAMAFSKKVIMLLAAKVVAKYRLVLTRADHEADLTEDDMEDLLVLGHVKRGLYAKFEKY
ncbi:cytochrome P450 3A43-like [Ixodes scapularis]|uniref:cytochrome P450 3A43-like n=1 Tax=Ixodes scapularis TaxID=6945 RepID=UPI001C3864E6|nr:cytochrome P450 3A43-like [Ixodes scapularis]